MKVETNSKSAFQNLLIWQKGMLVVHLTYRLARQLPKVEQFGLFSQMTRSVVSIPSNIAEGAKRGGHKEFANFLRIARGSAAELETQLLVVKEEYSFDTHDLHNELTALQKMLESFLRSM